MNKNIIYAHTQTNKDYKEDRNITFKQWKIYYYLLGLSKFDSNSVEDHRYLYKQSLNITQICRELGIKSKQTFYNAIKNLTKNRLIRYVDEGGYYLLYAKNWIAIDQKILINLVRFAKAKEANIDLLRIFLILKKIDSIADCPEEREFTARGLITLLGHSQKTASYYYDIKFYLGLLSFWGLITIKTHVRTLQGIGNYTVYHLQQINETNLHPDFESDIEAEKESPIFSPEFIEKIQII